MSSAPGNVNIVVVGDKAVAERLARFAADGKVHYYDENGTEIDMADMAAPSDVTPKQVINDYVDAIGGMAALKAIRNYSQMMEASIQGQTIQQTMAKEGGTKFSSQTMMMGNVMADQRYNDGTARMTAQGQTMPPNPDLDKAMAAQAALFPVADMANVITEVTVDGTEMVDGKKAIVLKHEDGRYYFDAASKLLVRQVQSQMGQTVTIDYGDYKTVEGVKFPYTTTMTGMMPFPLEMKTTDIKVNTEIDQTLFDVN